MISPQANTVQPSPMIQRYLWPLSVSTKEMVRPRSYTSAENVGFRNKLSRQDSTDIPSIDLIKRDLVILDKNLSRLEEKLLSVGNPSSLVDKFIQILKISCYRVQNELGGRLYCIVIPVDIPPIDLNFVDDDFPIVVVLNTEEFSIVQVAIKLGRIYGDILCDNDISIQPIVLSPSRYRKIRERYVPIVIVKSSEHEFPEMAEGLLPNMQTSY